MFESTAATGLGSACAAAESHEVGPEGGEIAAFVRQALGGERIHDVLVHKHDGRLEVILVMPQRRMCRLLERCASPLEVALVERFGSTRGFDIMWPASTGRGLRARTFTTLWATRRMDGSLACGRRQRVRRPMRSAGRGSGGIWLGSTPCRRSDLAPGRLSALMHQVARRQRVVAADAAATTQ